jgi:branched-chain amino acid transport system ATP-binding protein
VLSLLGRSERIRTSDPIVPNDVRYQAALHSDIAADLGRRTGLIGALVTRRKRNKMDVVRSLADRIIVLTNGQLVADGESAAVIASSVVQEAYLRLSPGKARMSAALTFEGLHTHIGRYHILQGVDFDAPAALTTLLLGRDGAGKTTTLRTIMGLWRVSEGRITLGATALQNLAASDVARLGVGYAPETMAVFPDLSVKENLVLGARDGPLDDARLAWIFGFFPALKKFWLARAGALSGGQKQVLSIARAIVEPRELLLIDEPTKGLSPSIVGSLIACLNDIRATRVTILAIEQNFRVAREVGDEVRVMDNGGIVHRSGMADLAADDRLQNRLLGLSLDSHE